jgi:hypothetical protein
MKRWIHGALDCMADEFVSRKNIGGAMYTMSALADRQHTTQLLAQLNSHLETIFQNPEAPRSQ